jgi:hypothetical protein
MPDLDDVRGVSLATVHALTTAAMIVGVPVLIGRRSARGQKALTAPVAIAVGVGLTLVTQRATWGLVRLWLRMDQPS